MPEETIKRTKVEPKKVPGPDLFWYELDDTNVPEAEATGQKMIAAVEKMLFIDADMVPVGREVFARSLKEENLFLFGRCFPKGLGNFGGPQIQAKTSGKFYPVPDGEYFIVGMLRDYFEAGESGRRTRRNSGTAAPHRG